LHRKLELDSRGKLAAAFIERWAMVAAEQDGEDTAGRQKLRRLTPEELASHACDTVDAMYRECRIRGWILSIPSLTEIFNGKTVENEPTEGIEKSA